jgi:hypothetical protein
MKIFIETNDNIIMSFDVEPSDPIETLKLQIENKIGLHPYLQRLNFQGHLLEEGRTFNHYKITNESTIHLLQGRR